MPWSPIPKFPNIIRNLRKLGYAYREIPVELVHKEIMRETGIIKEATIKQTLDAMIKLDYIKLLPNGMYMLPEGYEVEQEELDKRLDKK